MNIKEWYYRHSRVVPCIPWAKSSYQILPLPRTKYLYSVGQYIMKNHFVHETSIIDPGVSIGPGTKIWQFSHVLKNTTIGEDCTIGKYVEIGPDVSVGRGCKIQNNVSVFKGITLEDYVFCGPSVVFTNIINPRAAVRKMDQVRPTLVKKHATLGANSTIICGVTIGEYAMVGAGAVVSRDVPDFALVVGNPARHTGWMSRHGEKLDLPTQGRAQALCPATGEKYSLENDILVRRDGNQP